MKQLLAGVAMILAAVGTTVATDFDYRPAASLPVTGTLAPDASEVYSRLPDSLKGKVRDELWALGLNSAGLAVRFRSDSPALAVR